MARGVRLRAARGAAWGAGRPLSALTQPGGAQAEAAAVGKRWAAGLGGCGGVLGGGRERRRRPRRRAASGPGTRLPGHRPGGPGQVAAELGPGRALLAGASPSPPRPAPWQLPWLSLAEASAACAPKSCGLRVGRDLGFFFFFFPGRTPSLTRCTSGAPCPAHLEFWPKPVCLIQGNRGWHLDPTAAPRGWEVAPQANLRNLLATFPSHLPSLL